MPSTPSMPAAIGESAQRSAVTLPSGVLASIPLDSGTGAAPMALGFGAVWVGGHRSSLLYRINPHTDKITARINLGQETCGPIVMAAGRVWTGFCDGSTKELAVDPTTNQVVGSIQASEMIGDLGGSLWAASADSTKLLRIDPKTHATIATIHAPGDEGVIGGGFLWIADENVDTGEYSGVISKVDPTTGAVVSQLHTLTTDVSMYMIYARGVLWLKGASDAFLVRVDTATGKSAKVALVGFTALSDYSDDPVVDAMGSMWLRTASGVVSRLSLSTGASSATFAADPDAQGGMIAVGFGSLWEANFDSDTVWRVRTA
jgi:streptogramin lyase